MSLVVHDLAVTLRATKRELRAALPNVEETFTEVVNDLRRDVDEILDVRDRGHAVIPSVDFREVQAGTVSGSLLTEIRRRGAVVIRRVFSQEQAAAWNGEIGDYLARNRYQERPAEASVDRYFSTLASGRPQIFGIYWSKPQVAARQHPALAEARAFLNRLWRYESEGAWHFDPDRECTYADRIRRREPGDLTLGLSPHMDAGSVERWIDPNYRRVYRQVFSGNWRAYEPFDGAWRTATEEIPSPAVCSMFRTYQGWTALTAQGPGDGTLQLMPIAKAIVYLLLRPLLADVPEDVFCGAEPGRALSISADWHPVLMPALSPIPPVEPGDTVWWHPDIVHAVEDEHRGKGYSNVVYAGAAPLCPKNARYLERQKAAFLKGESAPDFAPENYETTFEGRATTHDLTELGRKQMGLEAW
jgi:hypothetical protein